LRDTPVHIETMDVDSDESVKQAFGRTPAQGPVDVLVNNAGIEWTGAIEETPVADFRTCMETNYFGAIRCIQAVLRPMRERGSGAIITVTSVAGKISVSPMGPYSASKFALEALSEGLAQELKAFGVRVAIVEPGIIDTRMARKIKEYGRLQDVPSSSSDSDLVRRDDGGQSGPASGVAQKVREIVESGTWQLRHRWSPMRSPSWAGADRALRIGFQWSAQGDSDWLKPVKADFGMDLKLD
jgi:NAD(P)-dependent dehydrogenase (short-subunit alcohol dehydrogenase family)